MASLCPFCGIVPHCDTVCDTAWSVTRTMQAEKANHAHLADEYAKHPGAAAVAWGQLGAGARALPDLSATVRAYDAGRVSCAPRHQCAHARDPTVHSLDSRSWHRR